MSVWEAIGVAVFVVALLLGTSFLLFVGIVLAEACWKRNARREDRRAGDEGP